MAELASLVAAELAADGWQRRELGPPHPLVLTRPLGVGILAVTEVMRPSSYPLTWPEELWLHRGIGYEPALDLSPLLTVRPQPMLLHSDEDPPSFELRGPGAVPEVAAELVRAIRADGAAFAAVHDVDSLVAALGERRDDMADVRALATVLAAAGQGGRALAVLESATTMDVEWVDDAEFVRFGRQLRRWVAAGSATIPPVEETLRRLPAAAPTERPSVSFSRARATAAAEQEAKAAVRAQAKDKSHQAVVALLIEEYRARGLDLIPSTADVLAQGIELELQPFGRLRAGVQAVKALTDVIGDVPARFRSVRTEDPEWMRPPPRATYPAPHGRRWVTIALDPAAGSILTRAWADGSHRLGPLVDITLWLDTEPGGASISVRLGEHRLGTLPPDAAAAFRPHVAAAVDLYDESVRIRGRLLQSATDRPPLLEVGLPS